MKLQSANIDPSLISSPSPRYRFETAISRSPGGGLPTLINMQVPSEVISVLSDTVSVSDRVDSGTDEIAEIVSSHIRSDRHTKATTSTSVSGSRQDTGSVVAHFKNPTGN
jgi:hypothetical protein